MTIFRTKTSQILVRADDGRTQILTMTTPIEISEDLDGETDPQFKLPTIRTKTGRAVNRDAQGDFHLDGVVWRVVPKD